MLKVLHVVGGMDIGGTETMLMNLYRKLKHKIKFDFISYYDYEGYYDKEIKELGGEVIRLNDPKRIGRLKAIKELSKVIKKNEYDAVHVHTLFNSGIGVIGAYRGKCKVRICHSHTNSENKENLLRKIYMSIMRSAIKVFSTDFLACSKSAGEYLFGKNIYRNKKFKVIPNYIDYEKILNYREEGIRKELNLNETDILIGHIGRFIEVKNQLFLLDIFKKINEKNNRYKLILVGYGKLENELKIKAVKLGISKDVYFLGVRRDVEKIVNSLDIFIMPSIYEGLGLVLLEAQGGRIPCLVSEAIQEEANLNLGLVKKLSLKNNIEVWEKEVYKMLEKNIKVSREAVKKAFYDRGYSIYSIAEKLFEIYKG